MRIILLCLLPLAALAPGGCDSVECGDGTIERAGVCVRADETFSAAKCGAFTVLVGGVCKPMFDPTVCDSATTLADVDPATGVTTCIGTGNAGCSAPIACPAPATGKQTICGQIYDFESDQPFAAAGATGARCQAGATAGPCALGVRAYDAVMFGMNPMTATPLAVGDTYIDDCGRYRLTDVTLPGSPFIGLGIDDANAAMAGPTGVTNAAGVATPAVANAATRGLEAFVAPMSTTTAWASSGGPPISGGIYAMVFRTNGSGRTNRSGITVSKNGGGVSANDYYFTAGQATRATVDAAATATGVNGTGLVTGATLGEAWSGTGLPAECAYPAFPGVALPYILFVQVLRPTNASGMTCPL